MTPVGFAMPAPGGNSSIEINCVIGAGLQKVKDMEPQQQLILFVIAVGAACYYFARRWLTAAVFVGATVVGTGLHLYKVTLAYPEVWVALSLIASTLVMSRVRLAIAAERSAPLPADRVTRTGPGAPPTRRPASRARGTR